MIPYARQDIQQADIDAVIETLKSDFLTQGPTVERFERAVGQYVNSKYSFAVSNATSALHIACLALNLKKNDVVWASPITFVASTNCALYCGAKVDFVDIDEQTWNISPAKLEAKITSAKANNSLPKILIVTHFGGESCDMYSIKEIANQYNIKIIEDASHAIGGSYKNEKIGSCTHSDITVFSFHPVKIITTGEGGLLSTNDSSLANAIRLLRSHGITRDQSEMTQHPDGDWYYEQISLGYNYRMTDIQAALGLSQLSRIDDYINKRHAIANQYHKLLDGLPILTQKLDAASKSALHLFPIKVPNGKRLNTFNYLRKNGIYVNVHYIPVHLQPYYKKLGFKQGQFPASEDYYNHAISLPMYTNLSEENQHFVCEKLRESLAE